MLLSAIVVLCAACAAHGGVAKVDASRAEPDVNTAMQWWTEMPDKVTAIGWKDHLCRFLVLFNGAIYAKPYTNSRTSQYDGLGVQLGFLPSRTGAYREVSGTLYPERDDGSVIQGMEKCAAPVVWSEWARDGLLLRQEVFAHIPGGGDIVTGEEPLFAWVRLSVSYVCEGLPIDPRNGFVIKINAPHIWHSMEIRNNINYQPAISQYPRALRVESEGYDAASGLRVIEGDGKVRLAVAPGQKCTAQFRSKDPTPNDYLLCVQMDAKKGEHIDLLVPMLPTDRDVLDCELALGYDKALAEANRYWSRKPATAARVQTPEEHINRVFENSVKYAELIADRDPKTGTYSFLTGAWIYADLWATPNAITSIMTLDTMGYHEVVAKHLQAFKDEQGLVKPPGDTFEQHPGFLGTKSRQAVVWMSDHGAVLYTICEHALLSGDKRFIEKWTPTVVRACEFIRDARRMKGHGGVEGLMPPAQASDLDTKIQSIWSDGWTYKGLITAVKLLRSTNHPRAEEFASEAADYKSTFVKAFRKAVQASPEWTDSRGKKHHFVPKSLAPEPAWETRHAFYLDTGPMMLVFSGLMDAQEQEMRSALMWFREGPQTKLYRHDSNCWQVPSLIHEISSCEPCYSWNLFHSWQLADRPRFVEGLYSLFVAPVSRQTYSICETRGGVSGCSSWLPSLYLARLAVIDDQIADGELHLLRLTPLAWLRSGQDTVFERMPTEYGPVTLRVGLADRGATLKITYSGKLRTTPKRLVLHVPPSRGLKQVVFNGKALKWDGKSRSILIDGGRA